MFEHPKLNEVGAFCEEEKSIKYKKWLCFLAKEEPAGPTVRIEGPFFFFYLHGGRDSYLPPLSSSPGLGGGSCFRCDGKRLAEVGAIRPQGNSSSTDETKAGQSSMASELVQIHIDWRGIKSREVDRDWRERWYVPEGGADEVG